MEKRKILISCLVLFLLAGCRGREPTERSAEVKQATANNRTVIQNTAADGSSDTGDAGVVLETDGDLKVLSVEHDNQVTDYTIVDGDGSYLASVQIMMTKDSGGMAAIKSGISFSENIQMQVLSDTDTDYVYAMKDESRQEIDAILSLGDTYTIMIGGIGGYENYQKIRESLKVTGSSGEISLPEIEQPDFGAGSAEPTDETNS